MSPQIPAILFIFAGGFSIAGAYFNWDWFMNNRRAWLFVKLLGRGGARVLYSLLGGFLIVVGIMTLF
jgi:drug/metabolite transporter superfamily protein YnfA